MTSRVEPGMIVSGTWMVPSREGYQVFQPETRLAGIATEVIPRPDDDPLDEVAPLVRIRRSREDPGRVIRLDQPLVPKVP